MAEVASETDELCRILGQALVTARTNEQHARAKIKTITQVEATQFPICIVQFAICNLPSSPPAILMPTESKNVDRGEIEANLRLHVDRLAGLIGPRTLKKPKTIQATIGYIQGQWAEMGYTIDRETYDVLGDESIDLIIEQPGTKRADEIVLLGAHYDTLFSTPGADDNASAVAVMLEVSRLLRNHTGRRTARYVAFACEEPPYFGLDVNGYSQVPKKVPQVG